MRSHGFALYISVCILEMQAYKKGKVGQSIMGTLDYKEAASLAAVDDCTLSTTHNFNEVSKSRCVCTHMHMCMSVHKEISVGANV